MPSRRVTSCWVNVTIRVVSVRTAARATPRRAPASTAVQRSGTGEARPIKRLERELSPASVIVTYRYVATIFKAASRDRRIALSPCDGIRLPKIVKKPVAPMATSDIQSLAEAVPKRYQAMVILAAGTGLRQGEIFGLTLDRVDFLRRSARVDRQLVGIRGQAPTFGPPKTASSVRTVPLPELVLEALSEHIRRFPPAALDGPIFTGSDGQLLRRSAFGTL